MFELNTQFGIGSDSTENSGSKSLFGKPKMFEPLKITDETSNFNSMDEQSIKGIGFKNNKTTGKHGIQQEIYSMEDLINSNPEGMKTFSYETDVVKTQLALVKKKEWQEILFGDIDWFQPIDFAGGFKKLFKL